MMSFPFNCVQSHLLSIDVTLEAIIHNSNFGPRSPLSQPTPALPPPSETDCNIMCFLASCYSSISSLSTSFQNPNDPKSVLKLSLCVSHNELSKLSSSLRTFASTSNSPALPDCKDKIDDALSRVNDSLSAMDVAPGDKALTDVKSNNIQTWINTAVAN